MDVKNLHPPKDVHDDILHRTLAHGILEYDDTHSTPSEYQQFNQSVAALSRPGLLPFHYCTFLYCGFVTDESVKTITPQDATMKDFRAIIDSVQYRISNSIVANHARYPGKWISENLGHEHRMWSTVKINCEGDIQCLSSMTKAKSWALVEDVLTSHCSISEPRLPVFLAQLAGLPWVFEIAPADHYTEGEKMNYAGRIFAAENIMRFKDKHVWATVLDSGTLYISNKDGAPIHPDHVLAFYDFAESQMEHLSENKSYVNPITLPGCEKLQIPKGELKRWFTRERFEAYWAKWVWQPGRACTYDHNDGGLDWYPCQPLIKSQAAWHPYAFVGRVWLQPWSDSVFESLRKSFFRLSKSFRL